MDSKYIWMDGEMMDAEKAVVPFLTPALHYGAAVFEGIRAYATEKGPAVFRLKEHAERLADSARVLGFRELPWTEDQDRQCDQGSGAGEQTGIVLYPPAHLLR
jgi:branched-chain amino acid aminotransferase